MAHLLVIDDDPVSLLVAEHILRGASHDVSTATGAESARAALRDANAVIDLVVCDVHMPGESGFDLLDSLTRSETPVPPFLMLTGVRDEAERGNSRADSAAGYLTKPVRSEDLLNAVESILQSSF